MKKYKLIIFIVFILSLILFLTESFCEEKKDSVIGDTKQPIAEEKKQPIIVDGDKVEFLSDTKEIEAEGKVIITYQGSTLTCDKIKVNTQTKDALAEGHVKVVSQKGEITGDKIVYNFDKSEGKIINGEIKAKPFYGKGESIERINASEFRVNKGYVTTCDLAHPHYRFQAKRIEVFPENKVIARNVTLRVGNLPLFYIPKFVQSLDENRPRVTLVPGSSKDWGTFLLQAWRYDFNQYLNGRLHLDYRERKDFAWGFDNTFDTSLLGKGILRTYYTNERNIETKHVWDEPRNTTERERFRIQLQQSKKIDDETNMVMQFNRMSDESFVKDYFYSEYEKDYQPDSYLLLTKARPYYSLNMLVRKRFNRYFTETERLPELKLDVPSYRLGSSYFYFLNNSSSAFLANKEAAPSDLNQKTFRFDTYNELSHQDKVGFVGVSPFVGVRETYFSNNIDKSGDELRNVLYSGINLSTKFYKLFDKSNDTLFFRYNGLRHIITPSITYSYIRKPNVTSAELIQYDTIDSIGKASDLKLSLENKLQTKRDLKTVDFLRYIVDSTYIFKHGQDEGGSFSNINSDLEFLPHNWIRLDADSVYDRRNKYFSSGNFDIYLHDAKHKENEEEKWSFGLGRRFERKISNQTTTELKYRLNDKWGFRIYERWYPRFDNLLEQDYTIVRDLHCWEMEINYNITRGNGSAIWLIMRLKAFPEMAFDMNKSYHQRKAGSQSE
ncbi:MAG TPA: LPS export ABC transporter periplasmic protein LptC [Candidatus Omnitrophota bacterium]|nr:LPS export ABC transporter periplasmic protein LptC [Candidatus Omnitrophota bacterium]